MASPPPTSMQHQAHTPVAPYHPPPNYPPPVGAARRVTDPKAVAAMLFAILGLVFAIPLGVPGMIAGPIAYFLGRGAKQRIAASQGALGGAGMASAGHILGIVTTVVGSIVTLGWLVLIFYGLNDIANSSGL
jgi:hypothetical protein